MQALTASIKQENIFGTGNYLGIEFNTGQSNRLLVLSTVDPYFTVDGVSRAVDVFYVTDLTGAKIEIEICYRKIRQTLLQVLAPEAKAA